MSLKSDKSSAVNHLRQHVGFVTFLLDQLWRVISELRAVRTGDPFSTSLVSFMSAVADRPVSVTQMWEHTKAHEIDSR